MIFKKDGKINEIVYKNTVYNEGKNRYYPTINDLIYLIDQFIEANETNDYIRFTPFYINYKLNRQIEFDDYMFYLECRDEFTDEDSVKHMSECIGQDYNKLSDDEQEYANILFPLCKNCDIQQYKNLLMSYRLFLNKLIPLLFKKIKEEININSDDVAFGYFCFEVHSE